MNPTANIKWIIDYNEQFREQVESGEPNPLADLTIRAGEYDLTGSTNDLFYLDDYLYFHFRKLLDAVEDVVQGEDKCLTLYSIPNDIVLRPEDDVVFVSLINSQGERKNVDVPESGVPVTKIAFVEELVQTAKQFHDKVVEINPDLRNSEPMEQLRQLIENVEGMTIE